MKKVYFLSTCSTCKRIINEVQWPQDIEFIDIKKRCIDLDALEWLKAKLGTYEALFSKKAQRFGEVKQNISNDNDYKKLMLSDYTFLKRPVILYGDFYSVGNDKQAVQKIKDQFNSI